MSRLRAVVAALFVLAAGASFAQDVTVTPDVVYGHKYGMALNRLGVWGGSAGGHLSLMLGPASDQGDPSAEDAVLRTGNRAAAVDRA